MTLPVQPERPRVGSVFSGVDGMWMGAREVIGGELAWVVESDRDASTVLGLRHPGVPNLGDVTAVDWSRVEPVDVLIGGPPCQAVSSAGKGLGSADPRWMWPEALRAMRELRPGLCVWENPARLLTGRDPEGDDDVGGDLDGWGVDRSGDDAGWFGWILGEVATLGFDAWWCCVRSSDVGAPHRRDRVFLACAPADPGGAGATAADADRLGREMAVAGPRRHTGGGDAGVAVALLPTPRATRGGSTTEVAYALGGGVTQQFRHQGSVLLPTPRASPNENRQTKPSPSQLRGEHGLNLATEAAARWGRYADAVQLWGVVFGRPAPSPVDDKGRLNPALPEWMLGFPPGWVTDTPISRTAQLRVLGNSCQPQVSAAATSRLLTEIANG